MTPIYRPGAYCDVMVWIDGRLMQVTSDGAIVRCYLENDLIWQQTAPEALLWCRGSVQGNLTVTVHQGQSGTAWLVSSDVRALGPTFGVQPVGIDAHEAYIVRSGTAYDRVGLMTQGYPSGAPGSSQGLSDVQPDGTLWWADQHRTVKVGWTVFSYPNVRRTPDGGTVMVGQVDPPGIAAAYTTPGGTATHISRVIDGDSFEPHVAVSPTGRVAICARTAQGAAYVSTSIAELGG